VFDVKGVDAPASSPSERRTVGHLALYAEGVSVGV
ncbi:MAG: hypothetical protein JWM05_1798, partial [Acidimicrobiales bacterium]|nr:hypothetical protein [Acidimicrobiales bacterium]